MQLSINGQERQFPELISGTALTRLIEVLQMKSDRVAVERNGEIVPRSDWDKTQLQDGDRLEIVQFVGGGCESISPFAIHTIILKPSFAQGQAPPEA